MRPGPIVLTMMLYGPNSRAIVLLMPTTPMRNVLERMRLSSSCLMEEEVELTMRPPPPCFMYGSAARMAVV